jgi:hypothetical protein
MNDCIDRLLGKEPMQSFDEENLECLSVLLTTIGKELDKKYNETKMKGYFDRLDKISKKKEAVSARIRFMIMDVADLRKNVWVPRRKDVNPGRIEEIRKEAEEEQQRLEAEYAKNKLNDKRMQQSTGQKGSQGGKSGGYQQNQQQVGKSTSMDNEGYSRLNKGQNGNMVNRIKEVKQITNKNLNVNSVILGTGGGDFSWNKPKQTTNDATPSSISTIAASSLSSATSDPSSQASSRDTSRSRQQLRDNSQTRGSGVTAGSSSISSESYEKRLNEILANPSDDNEAIFDKIEKEFEPIYESKLFIRALVISVCNSCLIDNKIDAELFKKRGSILNKFIAKKEDSELEALFSIQALDHRMKHQPGLLHLFFVFFS